MPYEFDPRDLDGPRTAREPDAPDDEARDAFERWLDGRADVGVREIGGETSRELYALALEVLEPLELSPGEATALPLAYPDRVTPNVGLFLSAAYNTADESVVAFDVDLPVTPRRVGYRLPAEKALVLDRPVHSTMAVDASGLVVNRTEIERYFGYSSDAVFLNAGSCLSIGFETARAFVDVGTVRGQSGATAGTRGVAVTDPEGVAHCFVGDDVPPRLASALDDVESTVAGDVGDVRAGFAESDRHPADVVVAELVAGLPDHD